MLCIQDFLNRLPNHLRAIVAHAVRKCFQMDSPSENIFRRPMAFPCVMFVHSVGNLTMVDLVCSTTCKHLTRWSPSCVLYAMPNSPGKAALKHICLGCTRWVNVADAQLWLNMRTLKIICFNVMQFNWNNIAHTDMTLHTGSSRRFTLDDYMIRICNKNVGWNVHMAHLSHTCTHLPPPAKFASCYKHMDINILLMDLMVLWFCVYFGINACVRTLYTHINCFVLLNWGHWNTLGCENMWSSG